MTRGTLNLLTQESVGVNRQKGMRKKMQLTPGEKLTGTSGMRTQLQSSAFF